MRDPRYAIYFIPGAETDLYRFGAAVLGCDVYTGAPAAWLDGVDSRWPEAVRAPRVYGFHATLKPPFRLADGVCEADLQDAFVDFAQARPAVQAGTLILRALGDFIALTPQASQSLLNNLADACVREFDRFRRPMSAEERARRLTPSLSARQIGHLDRWGYPYVFEDFRFHMTLTGALPEAARAAALLFLRDAFARRPDAATLIVDRIAIARQAEPGAPFTVMRSEPLGHSALRPFAYSC